MSKQIPHMFVVIIKKKSYSLIIMVAFLCLICVHPSSTFAASNLEEGIKQLAQQISNNIIKTGKKKIAVVEFSNLDGVVTAFGQHLAEELITELFLTSPGQFEVVERRQLMKVLSEQRLTMSGLLDAKAMESVGKILGIDAIVTGSMTDLESNIKINARVIGIETARVFAVARTSIPKIGIVAKLMEKEMVNTQSSIETAISARSSQRPAQQTKLGTKFQEFKDLRVEVMGLQVMQNNNVVIFLKYINKTKQNLYLSLPTQAWESQISTYLTDVRGNEYRLEEASGIRAGATGRHNNIPPLELTQDVPSTVSLRFKPRERIRQPGSSFSFTSEHVILAVDDYGDLKYDRRNNLIGESSFNVSISEIEPKKR
ncbi:MAG: FlgO family outer membrane protein [Candidatus Scalinduaceae bacterium]